MPENSTNETDSINSLERVTFLDPNGIFAFRENGYKDTYFALSELIDNSIQANSKCIEISLIERKSTGLKSQYLVDEIFVIDDGIGMDDRTLLTALRFGGGERQGAISGLGRFGMGLPQSSVAQCPRLEVYSWKSKDNISFNYLDLNEIKNNKHNYLPEVKSLKSTDFDRIQKEVIGLPSATLSKSGTIVRWMKCDRLENKRSSTILRKMSFHVGKVFRYYLSDGIKIRIRVFQDNGTHLSEVDDCFTEILPFDPLFLMESGTQLISPFNTFATSDKWQNEEYIFPDPIKHADLYTKIGNKSLRIIASLAKQSTRNEGGASPIGKIYQSVIGISAVRERREIELQDFGFIGDISSPINRWWKIEINFTPEFDELLGLDFLKQHIHKFKKIENDDIIDDIDEPNVGYVFISELSRFVSLLISEISKVNQTMGVSRTAAVGGTSTVPTPIDIGPVGSQSAGIRPIDEESIEIDEDDDDKIKELKDWLILRYPEYSTDEQKLNLAVKWFFKMKYNQLIVFLQLGAAELYDYKSIGHRTIIEINTQHEFYIEFLLPFFEDNGLDWSKIEPILLLFGAMVESEKDLVNHKDKIQLFRSHFAVKLKQFILEWHENK
jgi:hypothetical protein